MKRIFFLTACVFIARALMAQNGAPLLTNFNESHMVENQNWAICQDNDQVMVFANRKGISVFNGVTWQSIRLPVIPYSMRKNPATGTIYIGGDGSYGYLKKDLSGSYRYISLAADSSGKGVITRIVFHNSDIWFYSEQAIFRYNTKTAKTNLTLKSSLTNPFSGMFAMRRNIFVNVTDKGLYRVESDTLFPIVTGYLTEKTDVLFSLPYNDTRVLLGLGNSTLELFDGIKYYDYRIKDNGYLSENILSEGIALGDTAYAFSTLEGGAVVVDKNKGDLLFTINNQNELPDDEVFAIGSDVNGGLWLSHQYGLTRADLNLPISNFSIFPGLTGNLTSALKYGGELYVATSEGVFYLAEVKNYDEVEILVKQKVAGNNSQEEAGRLQEAEKQNSRKNIFTRIFGKKTNQEKPADEKIPSASQQKAGPAVRYTKQKVSRLKSINYVFKKTEGLNEKCRQLVATENGILAATNKGLFVIDDHKAMPVAANRYVNYISWQSFDDNYIIGTSSGWFLVTYKDGKWMASVPDPGFRDPVYSGIMTEDKALWLGSDNTVFRYQPDAENQSGQYSSYNIHTDFEEAYNVDLINDTVFLFTEAGICFFNGAHNSFDNYRKEDYDTSGDTGYSMPSSNSPVIRKDDIWISLDVASGLGNQELTLLSLFDDPVSVVTQAKNIWVIDGNNRIFNIDRTRNSKMIPSTNVLITGFYNNKGVKYDLNNVKFARGDNVVNFDIVAPGYIKQNTTQYQYHISKIMTGWSSWSVKTGYNMVISKPGDYILQVRARDIWGNIGQPRGVKFLIKAPLTKTPLFFIGTGAVILFLIILVIRFREKRLHNKNRQLEEKVKERTAEIESQKEEITASIEYASRIQMAMLPMESHFRNSFPDYFILFKPRDIVSGDFYWIAEDDKSVFFTVADCTGHGVPGAFMSTMGISTLNEIVANNRNLQASSVLNLLRNKTMNSLHQTGKEGEAADGMDIAFCVLDKKKTTLQFAGAYNPLIIFQGGELKEYKADRMPIGIYYGEESSFTNFVIKVNRGDALYIFSDGFADQFGGPECSKYKKSKLKKLLSEIYFRPMVEQRNILETEFDCWKGSCEQVDDITILGMKI